jgi:hypothetical protein
MELELMANVQIVRMEADTARKIRKKDTSVKLKRFRGAAGEVKTVRTIDANSKTLDLDLTYVFGKNVEAARRENKRVTGREDFQPAKR